MPAGVLLTFSLWLLVASFPRPCSISCPRSIDLQGDFALDNRRVMHARHVNESNCVHVHNEMCLHIRRTGCALDPNYISCYKVLEKL
jgi:hypothetical protein